MVSQKKFDDSLSPMVSAKETIHGFTVPHLPSLTCEDNVELEMEECFINVYTYSW